MKNRSILVMIEHMVMLLVFALAAAVCLRMFALSEKLSRTCEATDRSVLVAQNTAEMLKKNGVVWLTEQSGAVYTEENTWSFFYDENWDVSGAESMAYALVAKFSGDTDEFFWQAEFAVITDEGEELFCLPVAGQCVAEVTSYEEN